MRGRRTWKHNQEGDGRESAEAHSSIEVLSCDSSKAQRLVPAVLFCQSLGYQCRSENILTMFSPQHSYRTTKDPPVTRQ